MPFGPINIQPPDTLTFRNQIEEVDTAASDTRNADIADMNRVRRTEWREWQEEHQ